MSNQYNRGDRGERGDRDERSERDERRAEQSRKTWWWIDWSSRLFFATWVPTLGLFASFLIWVTTTVIAHDKRISELEKMGPKDLETLTPGTTSLPMTSLDDALGQGAYLHDQGM